MLTITKTPNKVKIQLDYLPKTLPFGQLSNEDVQKLNLRIVLKKGAKPRRDLETNELFIIQDDIQYISYSAK